eukprot:scaffold39360_cov36-Tisochrysis_lutea.AAC.3
MLQKLRTGVLLEVGEGAKLFEQKCTLSHCRLDHVERRGCNLLVCRNEQRSGCRSSTGAHRTCCIPTTTPFWASLANDLTPEGLEAADSAVKDVLSKGQ